MRRAYLYSARMGHVHCSVHAAGRRCSRSSARFAVACSPLVVFHSPLPLLHRVNRRSAPVWSRDEAASIDALCEHRTGANLGSGFLRNADVPCSKIAAITYLSPAWAGARDTSRPVGRSCATRYDIPPACARGTPTAPLPAPSLYTKNAAAFFAPGSPCGVRGYAAHLYPLRTSPRSWRPTSRPCAPPRVPLRVVRLVGESGVIDRATDAAPSRAGPRRNPAAAGPGNVA